MSPISEPLSQNRGHITSHSGVYNSAVVGKRALGELNFSNKAHGGAAAWIEESLGLMHGLRFRAICN